MAEETAKEKPETHWCGCIMWEQDDDDKFLYYVFEYVENKAGAEKQIKFPGGTNSDRPNEMPDETLHREVRKETGLRLLVDPKLIYEKHLAANPTKRREAHTKYCFLIRRDQCDGELITQPTREDGVGDYHSPVFPRTAAELFYPPRFRLPENEKLFWTHRDMLRAAIKELGDPTYIDPKD